MISKFPVQFLVFNSLIFLLSACGGGTEGTGGTGSLFKGQIKSEIGKPVASALVVLEETGDYTRANHFGRFAVQSKVSTKSVTLLVADRGDEAKATIDELPGTDVDVELDLELNAKKRTLTVIKKSVAPKKSRRNRRRVRHPKPEVEVTPEEEIAPTEDEVGEEGEGISEESQEGEEGEVVEVEPTTDPTPIATLVPNSAFTPIPTPVPSSTATATPTPTSTPLI